MNGAWAQACDGWAILDTQEAPVLAVYWLSEALMCRGTRQQRKAAELAGGYLRAWRKNLPEQGARMDDRKYYATPDELLWNALAWVCDAQGWADRQQVPLRYAESALRTWWKRQQEAQ